MKTFLQVFIALYCAQVWAWGIDGHKIVAKIAENNLTAKAKKEINYLMDVESLPNASIWADVVKFTPFFSHTTDWHFINLPDNFNPVDHNLHPSNNVVAAIKEMIVTIKDPSKSSKEKRQALKFLIHFVGDIHQPLHVGRGEDRGGNDVEVNLDGDHMNLHALWDSEIIDAARMNYKEYAKYLETYYHFGRPAANVNFPYAEVLAENLKAREAIYNFKSANGKILLDQGYLDRNREFHNRSLYLGGMRLAALLNGLF